MDKKLVIFLLIGLFVCLFVPLVSASAVIPAATGVHTASPTSIVMYPAGYASGEAFTANATCYLYNAVFALEKIGSPTGHLISKLYQTVGTVGTNAIPNGDALATSALIDIETGVYSTWVDITFTFDGSYQISDESSYFVSVEIVDGTSNVNNKIAVGTPTSTYAEGNRAVRSSGVWTGTSADIYFVINGDTETSGATPTPVPSTPSSTPNDGGMTALTNALLPILVPLLVMLIPAFLGLKFVGAWGFFAGLNVGMIIAYVTLAGTAYAFPLWGVVAMLIVDGLLLFGRVPLGRN